MQENNFVTIEDFSKITLTMGTIIAVEPVEKSTKLYRMQVDCGSTYGVRQILAGVRLSVTPEELLGSQRVFIVNLQPRTLMGLESQGMMLCAIQSETGAVLPLTITQKIPNGSIVR